MTVKMKGPSARTHHGLRGPEPGSRASPRRAGHPWRSSWCRPRPARGSRLLTENPSHNADFHAETSGLRTMSSATSHIVFGWSGSTRPGRQPGSWMSHCKRFLVMCMRPPVCIRCPRRRRRSRGRRRRSQPGRQPRQPRRRSRCLCTRTSDRTP